ncbi:hypothetical protein COLO4_02568 [Corchorus olitorius]|uniref:4Fe-4S ferredoxin-type domain-containing protein n=1 Tax=Corchorus olitorius TaxID=93759 RepID=A0A1R3L0Q2_9ROSI|nr:hypothetical protein COLO4_02568 [Corchorus olitorius]
MAGERFGVRNSGAKVVVEGIGDHGCEYMTGGLVVILGNTGRNFGAGMSGGVAYIWDKNGDFADKVNPEMIALEKLSSEDHNIVRMYVEKHQSYTQSKVATIVLDNWDTIADQFVKSLFIRTMGKPTGFLEFTRELPSKRPVAERKLDYKEIDIDLSFEQVQTHNAARCMDCGIPFCHNGCPLGNIIPEFNDAVYENNWGLAYEILSSTNNFPEFTGRICPAPCEASCVLGINKPPVTIEYIEKSIIEYAFPERLREAPANR